MRPDETYTHWRDGELRAGRQALKHTGVPGYHDARAAYACWRYYVITGHLAPVVIGTRTATQTDDRSARARIAHELGHGRRQIAASYIGAAR